MNGEAGADPEGPMEPGSPGDVLGAAVKRLFGLSYLFPYQRLVVANILEAAEAAGIPVRWPDEAEGPGAPEEAEDPAGASGEESAGVPAEKSGDRVGEASDRESFGRQIVILPTGAGKSLCFQLPAMLLRGPTLVIYPILSLMADQERRLRERGFSPVILRGGQSREEREGIWEKLRTGESPFIIANPEVLLTPAVLGRLEGLGIVHVVIDEAHCVSEWGESFRPAYLEIFRIIQAAGAPIITAFTATASAPVLEKIDRYVFGGGPSGGDLPGAHRIIGNPDRSNIYYSAQGCLLRDLAVRDLILRYPRPAIVFCSSQPGTEKLARYLRSDLAGRPGFEAGDVRFYHAGLSREEKAETEAWFFENSRGVLIATCAYGMGIDKADIRTVIHRDCPPSVEAYLQESGRAGRDGKQSRAVLLWVPGDEGELRRASTEISRRRLMELMDYGRNTRTCRRRALLELLNYQGEGESPETACCDVCEGTAREVPREKPPLTGFFHRNRRRYTLEEAVRVLARSEATGWSEGEVRGALGELLKRKTLGISRNPLWKDKLILLKGS